MAKKYRAAGWLDGQQWFENSGEFRQPKKGEHYLSGAIPEVYKAPNDLGMEFQIMKPVPSPAKVIEIDGFKYHLMGA